MLMYITYLKMDSKVEGGLSSNIVIVTITVTILWKFI